MKKKVEVGGTCAGGESGGVRASLILVTRGPVQSSSNLQKCSLGEKNVDYFGKKNLEKF